MLVFAGMIIYFCKPIVVPVYFSLLVAILLLPLNGYFEKLKFSRGLSAFISVLAGVLVIIGVLYFLSSQIRHFLQDIPTIRMHIEAHYASLQNWIANHFNVDEAQQASMFNKLSDSMNTAPEYAEQMFLSVSQTITFISIVAVCAFLILYYKHHIRNFFFALIKDKKNVDAVMTGSKEVIKNYMLGLVVEMFIVAILNSIVLLLIGIKYAIFLAAFAAILNIIPFVGIFTGIVFIVMVTLTTSASMGQVFWIIAGMVAIHFVDSNFIMPKIVGSRVKINALVTIIGAFLGSALLGLEGVFLALPTIAILKIIFDRIEELKPWGLLLGGEESSSKNKNQ
jgi:predicted PurR-regulated permease PerM